MMLYCTQHCYCNAHNNHDVYYYLRGRWCYAMSGCCVCAVLIAHNNDVVLHTTMLLYCTQQWCCTLLSQREVMFGNVRLLCVCSTHCTQQCYCTAHNNDVAQCCLRGRYYYAIDWCWLPIFRTNLVRGPWNKEMKFQNKGAVLVQIAPLFIQVAPLFISQPHSQNHSTSGCCVCAILIAHNNTIDNIIWEVQGCEDSEDALFL